MCGIDCPKNGFVRIFTSDFFSFLGGLSLSVKSLNTSPNCFFFFFPPCFSPQNANRGVIFSL